MNDILFIVESNVIYIVLFCSLYINYSIVLIVIGGLLKKKKNF